MGTYIIRDVQDFLIERWGQKQMRSDVDLQLAAHAKQVRLENAQLREQNRVLRCAIEEYAKAKTDFDDKRLQEDHHAWRERYTRLVGAETILLEVAIERYNNI